MTEVSQWAVQGSGGNKPSGMLIRSTHHVSLEVAHVQSAQEPPTLCRTQHSTAQHDTAR